MRRDSLTMLLAVAFSIKQTQERFGSYETYLDLPAKEAKSTLPVMLLMALVFPSGM
jgi:hypothetical protein